MSKIEFKKIFSAFPDPVIICDAKNQEILFANTAAKLLLEIDTVNGKVLSDIMRFKSDLELVWFIEKLIENGSFNKVFAILHTLSGNQLQVSMKGNAFEADQKKLVAIYLEQAGSNKETIELGLQKLLNKLLYMVSLSTQVSKTIELILGTVGGFLQASRMYVFENVDEIKSKSAYSWCDEGIECSQDALQNVPRTVFTSVEELYLSGLLIAEDVSVFSKENQEKLEEYGVKAILILPIYYAGRPIGFLSLDECKAKRKWQLWEIQLMQSVADIIGGLVIRRKVEGRLENSISMMSTVLDNMDSLIYVADIQTKEILFANRSLRNKLGYNLEEEIDVLDKVREDIITNFEEMAIESLEEEQTEKNTKPAVYMHKEYFNKKDGHWYYSDICTINWVDGRRVLLESMVEITERKKLEKELERFAAFDGLTGTYNRDWGNKLFKAMLQNAKMEKSAITVYFVDVDKLKQVNDTFGHLEGDKVLRTVADALKSNIRSTDILYRWGGDEFIIVMKNCPLTRGEQIVDNIMACLEKINKEENHPYNIACSFGVKEILPDSEETLDEIISYSDKKMYSNKASKNKKPAKV